MKIPLLVELITFKQTLVRKVIFENKNLVSVLTYLKYSYLFFVWMIQIFSLKRTKNEKKGIEVFIYFSLINQSNIIFQVFVCNLSIIKDGKNINFYKPFRVHRLNFFVVISAIINIIAGQNCIFTKFVLS